MRMRRLQGPPVAAGAAVSGEEVFPAAFAARGSAGCTALLQFTMLGT